VDQVFSGISPQCHKEFYFYTRAARLHSSHWQLFHHSAAADESGMAALLLDLLQVAVV
jgi:hypothetical protein